MANAKTTLIRNFSIIAHIDHGKSTLADRLLDETGAVSKREMRKQFLDSLDLERERGITIKLKTIRMEYPLDGRTYTLNLVDTPGHTDFSYEVSRSLVACEGAILLVDASQGVQAQTVSHARKAFDLGLTVIPVVNKIDLDQADPEGTASELAEIFGFKGDDILFISAKSGMGINNLLLKIVSRIPPPQGDMAKPFRALVFDSNYDEHLGVVALVRVVDGELVSGEKVRLLKGKKSFIPQRLSYASPTIRDIKRLRVGDIGLVATGIKEIWRVRVGDTLVKDSCPTASPLGGYKDPKPVVFLSLYPEEGVSYEDLKKSLLKLRLNDASLTFEPELGGVLGQGFRCGFLGLLHAEIVRERLEREFNVYVISTIPSVSYKVKTTKGNVRNILSPSRFPAPSLVEYVAEPFCTVSIFSPGEYTGSILELAFSKRASLLGTQFTKVKNAGRVRVDFSMPLSELVTGFYSQLKSISSGYASLDYTVSGYEKTDICRLDIVIAEETVGALSRIVHRRSVNRLARVLVKSLKENLPREQFALKIQAVVGGKVIARETLPAFRKDVTAKLYGGDITRKMKLLKKQKKGKKMRKIFGKARISKDIFWKVARLS